MRDRLDIRKFSLIDERNFNDFVTIVAVLNLIVIRFQLYLSKSQLVLIRFKIHWALKGLLEATLSDAF